MATIVDIEYEVSFRLDESEQYVVMGRAKGSYVMLEYVSVTRRVGHSKPARVYANGRRVKKNGETDKRIGEHVYMNVDLPNEHVWIDRAQRVISNG